MSTKWRKHGAVAVLLAVGLALTACDPGEDPTNPPTSETTAPVTTEPTEPDTTAGPPEIEPPEPPDGMDVDDHQGAALAAGYFLELYSYMRATWDTSRWEAMSSPDCSFCTDHTEYVQALEDHGAWIEGGAISFEPDAVEVVLPTEELPAYTVLITGVEEPLIVHEADGTFRAEPEARDMDLEIGLKFIDGRFIVQGVNLEAA